MNTKYTLEYRTVKVPISRRQAESLIEDSYGGSLTEGAKKMLDLPRAQIEITEGGLVKPSLIHVVGKL